jgi:hypothetical protein
MKTSLRTLSLSTIIASALTAQASYAQGLSITTSCKSMSSDDSRAPQLSLKLVRTIDYASRTARVDAEYDGTIQWDAQPHATQGKFSAALPVAATAGLPRLPGNFSVNQGAESVSMSIEKEAGTKAPFRAEHLNFKFEVSSGTLGFGAQYAVLKMALPNSSRGTVAAFGNLYLTNRSESDVTSPDGSSEISMICESQIHDL